MQYTEAVDRLDRLVKETCALWEPGWVTFNWRGYTYDHVQRVRGLALTIFEGETQPTDSQPPGKVEERAIVDLASLLHDITKPYDGEYVTDEQGKRIVDEKGFWRNEVRKPSRRNEVTELYDELGLAGQLHHESGATVAYYLLQRSGFDRSFSGHVAQAIRDHLQPHADAPLAGRCLYDADTIDANVGLPAFIRNVYISSHFHNLRKSPHASALETLLQESPIEYLRPYIVDRLPAWSAGKERDFVPRLLTATARDIATRRLARLANTWRSLAEELESFEWHRFHGRLAVLLHFMYHTDDPSIAAETSYLADNWLASNGATPDARELLVQLQREMAGQE